MSIKKPIWKSIKGYEGLFKISSDGKIKTEHGLDVKPYVSNHGSAVVLLTKDGSSTTKALGKLVLETFKGTDTNNKIVQHLDNDPMNNSLDNLEWGVKKNNTRAVRIKCLETGQVFASVSDAARTFNIPAFKITRCCNKGVPMNGYHFVFEDKQQETDSQIKDLEGEEWKLLKGSNDNYMISNMGRIKRLQRVLKIRGLESNRPEKIIEPKLYNKHATVHIRIYDEFNSEKRIMVYIAKQVLYHFTTDYDGGKIKYLNGDSLDCRLENLVY